MWVGGTNCIIDVRITDVMFCVPVATTIVHEGNKITLHAPVGRILRIEILEGQEPRALVNLFYYPAGLPAFPL
jgi:hypothetical protein